MEEKVKNIISGYTKLPVEQIEADTVIDRTVLASSILVHRMYAQLSNEGYQVDNYTNIKTFGALMQKLNGKEQIISTQLESRVSHAVINNTNEIKSSIGIDIEEIQLMPIVNDFREEEFYKMNFSASEIAYCILQQDPYATFAGLFAAKEAIVKADNHYLNTPFNNIVIDHLPGGKPVHPQFQISISHTTALAVAVAVQTPPFSSYNSINTPIFPGNNTRSSFFYMYLLIFFSITLSAIVLFILLLK